jgi:ubiquinone/menaquinone biosynthesis C-methylase UbiE
MAVIAPPASDPVVAGYGSLAPYYDAFTASYDYDAWITAIERLARDHGLRGTRLLDVACGTGKSFEPLLDRGYDVTACDISPEMVAAAAEKFGSRNVHLLVADMRALPDLGSFDLITCLDDSINYLLEDRDLLAALRGMARCLRDGGLVVFDCNSATTYRTAFTSQFVRESEELFFSWRGEGSEENGLAKATIDIFARDADSWTRSASRHVQRHYPRAAIEATLRKAGLDLVATRGQSPGGRLEPEVDEGRHTKVVYVARKPRASIPGKEVGA